MIHIDTNLLIGAVDPTDEFHAKARRLIADSQSIAVSAVAWMEFHSHPISPLLHDALKSILSGGIIPFDADTAVFAGEIFHRTGAHRRTRIDTMIAATAILAGVELATFNPSDFQAFTVHGLQLRRME